MKDTYKIGIFDKEESFISSINLLQEQNIVIHDVFTPYPVHEVFHLLKRKSKLPTAAYFFGLFGIIITLAFLYYTSVVDWPIVYGGKPFNSFPSFIVVTIILTIFIVTIASLAAFSVRSKLFPGRDNTIFDFRATDNMFVIVIINSIADKASYDKAAEIMLGNGALEVFDKEFDTVKA